MRQPLSLQRAAFTVFAVSLLARSAAAQSGRVAGVVNDEEGRPIRAATVTAELPDTGQTFTSSTDDKGRFVMLGLRAGTWTFYAQAPGFAAGGGTLPVRFNTPNPVIAFRLQKRGYLLGPLGGITAKDLQAQITAADALFGQQKWDQAIGAYRSIVEKSPALSVIYLQIAAAYLSKKDYSGATAAYNDLLKLDPTSEKAAIGLGLMALEKGDRQAAEETLLKAAGTPSAGRDLFYTLGDLQLAKGENGEAIRWYTKAADVDPSWGKPLYKLGVMAMNSGDKPSAAGFMEKVIAVDPESPEAGLAKTTIDQLGR